MCDEIKIKRSEKETKKNTQKELLKKKNKKNKNFVRLRFSPHNYF